MKDKRNTLSKLSAIALLVGLVGCGDNGSETYTDKNAVDTTLPATDWRMIWQDEFDGTEIDTSKWSHEIDCAGGGNQEQQCYTESSDNSFVSEGMLNIVAMPNTDDTLSQDYTSARLNSKMKGDWTYGRFEIRAKMPTGQGTHPAIWMMPTDDIYGGWPHSGEIDIAESVNLKVAAEDGTLESHVYGALHYGKAKGNESNQTSGAPYLLPDDANPADDFHTYAIEWQEGEIRWYVDGYLYQTQRKSEVKYNFKGEAAGLLHKGWYTNNYNNVTGEQQDQWTNAPFDQSFHMILNFAVGGSWAGQVNNTGIDASAFAGGNTMLVDYVRVYQCDIAPMTGEGCATIRAGYNEEATEIRPDGALVTGSAPTPPPPALDPNLPAPPLVIFATEIIAGWDAWDCCGDSTPTIEIDDAEYGDVVEFIINGETVVGFSTRAGHGVSDGVPFNASNMIATGTVEFDLKMTASPGDTAWMFKIESDEAATAVEIALSTSVEGHAAPELGTWQHYTFNISDLVDAGLDPTQIDVLMIFPTWGTGNGAVFRVDNLIISKPDGDTGTSASVVIFDETNRADWLAWDCCTGSTPSVEADDGDHNNVVEFGITGETVMGFSTRDSHGATGGLPFDASSIVTAGTISFELKMTASPGDVPWKFKIESNEAETAVEIDLSTSIEGHATPELGVWQTYTFNIADLVDAGLDPSAIDVVMMYPAWGQGNGAVYRVDNVRIGG
jgi:beta-glucanase (GH16 family)